MRRIAGIAGLLLCAAPWTVIAQEAAPILARAMTLQPPVWVERAGLRQALAPGAALYPGDQITTGSRGRLHLELEDSSEIKLGSAAEFALPELQVVDDGSESGLLKGSLKVLKGALRFTSGALAALRKRNLDVYVGPTITAGIRGTDIYASSATDEELLCLLEGRIEVSSPGQDMQVMDQPRSFFVVPRGQAPRPIAPTPQAKLATWLPQTEMAEGRAALEAGGRFRLVLLSVGSAAQAEREAQRLSALGYATQIQPETQQGRTRYRLTLPGFASHADADRFRRALPPEFGLKSAWVLAPG